MPAPSVADEVQSQTEKKSKEKDRLLTLSHLVHAAEHSLSSGQASVLAQNTSGVSLSTRLLFAKQAHRLLFFGTCGTFFFFIKILDFLFRSRSAGEKVTDIFTPEKTRLLISFIFEGIGGALLFSQKELDADNRNYVAIAFAMGFLIFGGFIGANGDPRKMKEALMSAARTSPREPLSPPNNSMRSIDSRKKPKESREETMAQFFACRRGFVASGGSGFSMGLNENNLLLSNLLLYTAVFDILCGSIVILFTLACCLKDCLTKSASENGRWRIIERNILDGKKPQFIFAAMLSLTSGIINLTYKNQNNYNAAALDFASLCAYLAGSMTVLATASPQLAAMLGLSSSMSMLGFPPSFAMNRRSPSAARPNEPFPGIRVTEVEEGVGSDEVSEQAVVNINMLREDERIKDDEEVVNGAEVVSNSGRSDDSHYSFTHSVAATVVPPVANPNLLTANFSRNSLHAHPRHPLTSHTLADSDARRIRFE